MTDSPDRSPGPPLDLKGHELRSERWRLEVVPGHGCVWRSLRLRARGRWVDVVPPSRDDAALLSRAQGFGSFIMAPWPNRIEGPTFEWGGVTHRLRVNAADGTAIHGDVRTRPWVVEEAAPERLVATLSTLDHPNFNFPYALRFRHELRLDGARVSLGFEVENIDARAAPVGFGFHPYFQRFLPLPGGGVEEAEIRVPARRVYPAARCLPTGPAEPVAGDLDLRRVGPIGRRALDHCFTDLERPEMECVYPTSGTRLLFELGPAYTHVVVFAPVDSQGGPRPFVALEPMTQVTNAFVLCARGWEGTGARELGPGERFGEVWSIVDAPLTPAAS